MRMMTGKKSKLTLEEKEERRKESAQERDEYISHHLGGFTQIFPLPSEHPLQQVYDKLLLSEGNVMAEPKKPKNEPPAIVRRNTEKFSKLPVIAKDSMDSVKP